MADVIRLSPILYVVTPLGDAEAYFLQIPIDTDQYAYYGCFQIETKENWWFDNTMIRIAGSVSGRRDNYYSEFYMTDAMLESLTPHILRHKKSPLYEKVLNASLGNSSIS
jgi:hypothetical protein